MMKICRTISVRRCCVRCLGPTECCGKAICGLGESDKIDTPEKLRSEFGVERDACIWKHALLPEWEACGHLRCSLATDSCHTCSTVEKLKEEDRRIAADKKRVDVLIADPSTSQSLRAALAKWAAGSAPSAKREAAAALTAAAAVAEGRRQKRSRECVVVVVAWIWSEGMHPQRTPTRVERVAGGRRRARGGTRRSTTYGRTAAGAHTTTKQRLE